MPGDHRWAGVADKEIAIGRGAAWRRLRCAPALLLLVVAGCANATNCIERVPEKVRADVIRFVVERGMLTEDEVPRSDLEYGREYGRDPSTYTGAEVRELSKYALGYSHCVRGITRRD